MASLEELGIESARELLILDKSGEPFDVSNYITEDFDPVKATPSIALNPKGFNK